MYFEPEYSRYSGVSGTRRTEYALETKLRLLKNFLDDRLVWAGNLNAEFAREKEGDEREGEAVLGFSSGLAYRFAAGWYGGAEVDYRSVWPELAQREAWAFFRLLRAHLSGRLRGGVRTGVRGHLPHRRAGPGSDLSRRPLTQSFIELTKEQRRPIEDRSRVKVRDRTLRAWRAEGRGWFIVDEVLGKHELITYAIGLSNDGRVLGLEIMEYRESYGHEVRDAAWRKQFVGKSAGDALKLDADIRNISGATLSARHIADGVRRLLATYQSVLK